MRPGPFAFLPFNDSILFGMLPGQISFLPFIAIILFAFFYNSSLVSHL